MKAVFPLLVALATTPSVRAHAQESPVRLAFVGDIMLDGLPGASLEAGVDPFAPFALALARADAAIGNLECSVGTTGTPLDKPYTFRASPRVVPVLARYFAAVSLANNHSGDYGPGTLLETMGLLTSAKLPFFGAGRDLASAHRALIVVRRGLRIALLGYDEFLPRRFEAGVRSPGVAWSEDEDVVTDIRRARAEGADIVIPFMHWGFEEELEPSARQRELAHKMLDAGADAVVGAHPHVTQGAELYRGKPIVYSLGNFVFDGFQTPATRTGWLLELEVTKAGVVSFATTVARLDERGIPVPDPTAQSPCAKGGTLRLCRGRAL